MVSEIAFVPHGICVPSTSATSQLLHFSSRRTSTTLGTNEFLAQRSLTMHSRVLQPFRLAGLRASLPAETISAEASTEVFSLPSTSRSWKPLEVFSLSPLQKERARRVFSRRVSSTASPNEKWQEFGKEATQTPDRGQELSEIDLIASPGALQNLRRARRANLPRETSAELGIVEVSASLERNVDEETILVPGAQDRARVSLVSNDDTGLASTDKNAGIDSSNKTRRRRTTVPRGQAGRVSSKKTLNLQERDEQALIQTGDSLEKDNSSVLASTEHSATMRRTADDVNDARVQLKPSLASDLDSGIATGGVHTAVGASNKARRRRSNPPRDQVERKAWRTFPNHQELVEETLQLSDDPLEKDGGRVVIFRGNPKAKLMIIGEGPGAEEDRLGLPFVGKSGQLLNRVFRFAGFNIDSDIYVTNVVKRRPLNNRAPTAAETNYYRGLLLEEIRLVDPKLVILTGRIAMEAMLPDAAGITKMRGKWYSIGSRVAMPVFHPSYLLRNPSAKSVMKEDVLEIRRKYLECVPGAQLDEIRNQGSA